ncbi:MFS transporter [Ferrimonas sp. SCSIO 43195]|uniref:MFS transporter n=1 Tax=Ferrimonas sp. SCSIO 43195 TaxID=2822844 RepID=UPI0020758C38|nr:MFS transporter [Ferrimonas sp. SCSIO 43195]USD38009.1 MFS transporter [Ferrimonas sp. SCSIO 43195]
MATLAGRNYLKALTALTLAAMVVFCNLYVAQPMLPMLAEAFELDAATANWLHAGAPLALAIFLIPWAMVSDAIGRRPIMLLSLTSLPLINLALLNTSSVEWFIVLRIVHGIMLAGFVAVAAAWMSEEIGAQRLPAAMGSYVAANAIGGLSGRLIGGMASYFDNWQVPFITLVVLSCAAALMLSTMLPQQRNFQPSTTSLRHAAKGLMAHLKNPQLQPAFLIAGLTFGTFVNLFTVLTFQLSQAPWSLTTFQLSLLFLTYLAGSISAQLSGRWLRYYTAPAGMQTGALFLIMGTVITLSADLRIIIVGLLLCSVGFFQIHSLAYSWVGKNAVKERAKASSLYLVHYYLGASLGGFVLLPIWEYGGWHLVVATSLGCYALIVLLAHKLQLVTRVARTAS